MKGSLSVALRMKSDLAERGNTAPARIAILGSAFKGRPETDDLRGSPVIAIIRKGLKALSHTAELVAWDPIVSAVNLQKLGLKPVATVEEAFSETSLVDFFKSPSCA